MAQLPYAGTGDFVCRIVQLCQIAEAIFSNFRINVKIRKDQKSATRISKSLHNTDVQAWRSWPERGTVRPLPFNVSGILDLGAGEI